MLAAELLTPEKLAVALFRKASLSTSNVVASKPLTLTCAPLLKTIPAGLIKNR